MDVIRISVYYETWLVRIPYFYHLTWSEIFAPLHFSIHNRPISSPNFIWIEFKSIA